MKFAFRVVSIGLRAKAAVLKETKFKNRSAIANVEMVEYVGSVPAATTSSAHGKNGNRARNCM